MDLHNNWINQRLNSTEISDVDNLPLTGRNIYISPEGFGKSTKLLTKLVNLEESNIDDPDLVIYSAHTIENAMEKYNFVKSSQNMTTSRKFYYIPSKTELFRLMFKSQSEDLYTVFRQASLKSYKNYINVRIFSQFGEKFKEIGRTSAFIKRYRASKSINTATADEYNEHVISELYKLLDKRNGNGNYFIFFKLEDCVPELENTHESDNYLNILENYHDNIDVLNNYSSQCGAICVRISGNCIKNWKGLRIQQEKDIKEIINNTKNGEKSIIFTQNKVVDNLILPEFDKNSELKSSVLMILDEITSDVFVNDDGNFCNKLLNVCKKVEKYGSESLSTSELYMLNETGIKVGQIEKKEDISLGGVKIHFGKTSSPYVEVFDPELSTRVKFFDNTIILTAETVSSLIIKNIFNYNVYTTNVFTTGFDNNFFIHPTSDTSDITTTKANIDSVNEFINRKRNNLYKYDSEIFFIGTKGFGTDMSLEGCKGRNLFNDEVEDLFTFTQNRDNSVKEVNILLNPSPNDRFSKLLRFFEVFENVDDSVHEHVKVLYTRDLINQALGRILGMRRSSFPDVKVNLYYYNKDSLLKNALDDCRYQGTTQTASDINSESRQLTINELFYNKLFRFYGELLSVKNNNEESDNRFQRFNLEYIMKKFGYTRKGIIDELLPGIFLSIQEKVNNSTSMKYILNDCLSEDYDQFMSIKDDPDKLLNFYLNFKENAATNPKYDEFATSVKNLLNVNHIKTESFNILTKENADGLDDIKTDSFYHYINELKHNLGELHHINIQSFIAINFWNELYSVLEDDISLYMLKNNPELHYENMLLLSTINRITDWIDEGNVIKKNIRHEIFKFKKPEKLKNRTQIRKKFAETAVLLNNPRKAFKLFKKYNMLNEYYSLNEFGTFHIILPEEIQKFVDNPKNRKFIYEYKIIDNNRNTLKIEAHFNIRSGIGRVVSQLISVHENLVGQDKKHAVIAFNPFYMMKRHLKDNNIDILRNKLALDMPELDNSDNILAATYRNNSDINSLQKARYITFCSTVLLDKDKDGIVHASQTPTYRDFSSCKKIYKNLIKKSKSANNPSLVGESMKAFMHSLSSPMHIQNRYFGNLEKKSG